MIGKKVDKNSNYSLRDMKAIVSDVFAHAYSKLPRFNNQSV